MLATRLVDAGPSASVHAHVCCPRSRRCSYAAHPSGEHAHDCTVSVLRSPLASSPAQPHRAHQSRPFSQPWPRVRNVGKAATDARLSSGLKAQAAKHQRSRPMQYSLGLTRRSCTAPILPAAAVVQIDEKPRCTSEPQAPTAAQIFSTSPKKLCKLAALKLV